MAVNSVFREIYAMNMLKKKGFSLIEIEGNDCEIRTTAMRIEGKKSVTINDNMYIINPQKRKVKGGMSVYRFKQGIAVGEDESGKYIEGTVDSRLLNEVVDNARSVGNNSSGGDKQKELIMLGLGGVIGLMLGWILSGVIV